MALYPISMNGQWGYINNNGDVVIPPQFEKASEFSESRAAVRVSARWGFVDESGIFIVDPIYSYADKFSEGLAAVKSDDGWGFVDQTGVVAVPLRFGEALAFSSGRALVGDNEPCEAANFYIDPTGEPALPGRFQSGGTFSEGRVDVKRNGACGFVDLNGRVIIPFEYWYVREFSEGLGYLDRGDGGYPFFVDRDGRRLFDSPGLIRDVFHEGLAPVSEVSTCGYMDATGKLVIPEQFAKADGFYEGRAVVKRERLGPWGAIDTAGTVVIGFKYDDVGRFKNGLLYFRSGSENGYVAKDGREVIRRNV